MVPTTQQPAQHSDILNSLPSNRTKQRKRKKKRERELTYFSPRYSPDNPTPSPLPSLPTHHHPLYFDPTVGPPHPDTPPPAPADRLPNSTSRSRPPRDPRSWTPSSRSRKRAGPAHGIPMPARVRYHLGSSWYMNERWAEFYGGGGVRVYPVIRTVLRESVEAIGK